MLFLFIIGLDEEGLDHAVDHLLGFPVQLQPLPDREEDVAGALMPQLQRLLLVYLPEHVQHLLALAEELALLVQEDLRGVLHPSDLVVVLALRQTLPPGCFGRCLGGGGGGEEVEEGLVAGELLLRFGGGFGAAEEDEGEVLGVGVAHLVEAVHEFADVGLAAPDEDHPVAEQVVAERQLLLSPRGSTKLSIGVAFQSMFIRMPCRLLPHRLGSAWQICGSARLRQVAGAGRGCGAMSSRHARIW